MSGSQQQQAKLVSYTLLEPIAVNQFKQVTYTLLNALDIRQYKLVTYVLITPYVIPTYGSIPVFPTLPEGYPINVTINMDTVVGTTKSLREMRVAQRTVPLWDIEILFEDLKDQTQNQSPYVPFYGYTQFQSLCQTFLMMYGRTGVFAFNCPWDNSRSNQTIGTGDGTTKIFTIYRTWGSGANATIASIGVINTITSVSVNGVVVASSTYSAVRNKIQFNTAPASGAVIAMTFSFYYLCRMVEDEQDFEEFQKDRWTVKSFKFQSVNWP